MAVPLGRVFTSHFQKIGKKHIEKDFFQMTDKWPVYTFLEPVDVYSKKFCSDYFFSSLVFSSKNGITKCADGAAASSSMRSAAPTRLAATDNSRYSGCPQSFQVWLPEE